MSTIEVLEQLKHMSNPERLVVIEAATRLVRNELLAKPASTPDEDEKQMRAAAMILKDLYEPGGELTEWTSLDAEEILDDYVQG